MKRFAIFALFISLALCAPTSNEITTASSDDKLVINTDFFPKEFIEYTAEHDIVSILVPLNALNFDDDDDDDDDDGNENDDSTIFFVEADIKDGVKEYKGLSVLKDKKVVKVLETGTDASAANDDTKTAYFSATDGLYIYNETEKRAVKYGSITDNLISLAKVNGSDLIYILTDKNEVYKVTDEGNKKVKVDAIVGAQQIVVDYSNNLYYLGADKQAYVVNDAGVQKIEGLPSNPTYVQLLKPPFILEDGIPIVVDTKSYIIYVNGSSEITDFEFAVKPTAYAMEATLLQYFAYDKKIYKYNVLAILLEGILEELRTFLSDKSDYIESIATRSRNDLKA